MYEQNIMKDINDKLNLDTSKDKDTTVNLNKSMEFLMQELQPTGIIDEIKKDIDKKNTEGQDYDF